MAMMQHHLIDDYGGPGVPYDDVGVIAGCEPPLGALQSGEPSWRGTHPAGELVDPCAPRPRLVPYRGESELKGRNPAPRLKEIHAKPILHSRRRRVGTRR